MTIGIKTVTEEVVNRMTAKLPAVRVDGVNSYGVRGSTPKGQYEIRFSESGGEMKTTFLAKGANPLKRTKLLCRTSGGRGEPLLEAHIEAIWRNEEELPWVRKERDDEDGAEVVEVLPFGMEEKSPRVVVRTSARTGFVSLAVKHAREMSPAEAKLVAKALSRAAKLASRAA
jgi:hypothetical protein